MNRYTMRPSRAAVDLLELMFSRAGLVAAGVALQSLLAWQLGPSGRGEFAVCMAFAYITAALMTFGMDWACSYFIASQQIPVNQTLSAALGMIITMIPIGASLAFATTFLPVAFFEKASPEYFHLAIAWSVTIMAMKYASSALRGFSDFRSLAKTAVLNSCAAFLATAFLLVLCDLHVAGPILAISACNLATAGVIFFRVKRQRSVRLTWPETSTLARMFHYACRVYPGTLGMLMNAQLGMLILPFFLQQEHLGLFAVAMGAAGQIIAISDLTLTVLHPKIASSDSGRADLMAHCCAVLSGVVFVVCVVACVAAPVIFPMLFSPAFAKATHLFWILSPGIWLRAVSKTLFAYFNGSNRPEIVSQTTMLNVGSTAVLLFALVPFYGLYGAAMATCLGHLLSSVHSMFKFRQYTSYGFWSLLVPSRSTWAFLRRHLNANRIQPAVQH